MICLDLYPEATIWNFWLYRFSELAFFVFRSSGSLGSRLTGAGWGGCAVSMVPSAEVEPFLEKVKQGYYIPKGLQGKVDQALFATKPGSGAAVYLV